MAGISTSEMAKFLNITVKDLRGLEEAGVLRRVSRNRWNPTDNAHSYLKHLQGLIGAHRDTDGSVSQTQAAGILGVTTRRLRQRDQEEMPPPRDSEGRYPCPEFGQWLIEDFRRGLGIGNDGQVYDYEGERARLTHHQANVASLDEQTKTGKLIPAELVLSTWTNKVSDARAKLLALPTRIASACAGRSAPDIEIESRKIVYEALHELAAGDNKNNDDPE